MQKQVYTLGQPCVKSGKIATQGYASADSQSSVLMFFMNIRTNLGRERSTLTYFSFCLISRLGSIRLANRLIFLLLAWLHTSRAEKASRMIIDISASEWASDNNQGETIWLIWSNNRAGFLLDISDTLLIDEIYHLSHSSESMPQREGDPCACRQAARRTVPR